MSNSEGVTVVVPQSKVDTIKRCARVLRAGGPDATRLEDVATQAQLGPRNQGLQFQPYPGQILVCDFTLGFKEPEIIKVRPVIVVSPQPRYASGLCTVVPCSTREPMNKLPHHYMLPDGLYPIAGPQMWVKCDLVQTVGLHRLDRIKVKFRKYEAPIVPDVVLRDIRRCILHALGMHALTGHL